MPQDTTTPFWKHCSLSPSFRAEEAGLTVKFSRSWPGEDSADHSHYAHDAIPEATISRLHDARHFWRPGHKTFSGFIKARERPQQGRGGKKKRGRRERRKKTGRTNLGKRRTKQRRKGSVKTNSQKAVSIKRGDDEQGRAYSERETKNGENSGGKETEE